MGKSAQMASLGPEKHTTVSSERTGVMWESGPLKEEAREGLFEKSI